MNNSRLTFRRGSWLAVAIGCGSSCGGSKKLRRRSAFTLLELLVTLAIVSMIAAVALSNYTAAGRRREFDEGVNRFETLLRALRVQAQSDGKRLRLEFEPLDSDRGASFYVSKEVDPVARAGEFTVLDSGVWLSYFSSGRDTSPVIMACELTGDDLLVARASGLAIESQGFPLHAVTFYPDGSCDSAEMILTSPHSKVTGGVRLELDGFLGDVTRSVISKDDMQQYR